MTPEITQAVFITLSSSTAITLLVFGFRITWWASKIDSKVTALHERVDKMEEK